MVIEIIRDISILLLQILDPAEEFLFLNQIDFSSIFDEVLEIIEKVCELIVEVIP